MSYQISKYEALKAVLKAEECDNTRLVNKMMQAIRRAARNEIMHNSYADFYVISEREKKCFEKTLCNISIVATKSEE